MQGRTFYIVPGSGGAWNAVDPDWHGTAFKSRHDAVEYARDQAARNQPSQVVMFDAQGRIKPLAHFRLPHYQVPEQDESGPTAFESALKAVLITGFAAAGVAVLGDLVERVQRDAKREARKQRQPRRERRVTRRG